MSSEPHESGVSQQSSPSVGVVVLTLLGFGLVSIPLAGFTWDVASDLISGQLTSRKALIGVPVVIALAMVLRLAARVLARLDSSTNSGGMQ
jgi:hypothetical protein